MSTKFDQKKAKKIRTIDDLDEFNSKDDLFVSPKKDLKRTTGYTLSESLIKKIEIVSKNNNISKSEVVNLILKDFFNKNKFN